MSSTYNGKDYLSCAETAKLVRKALKAEFPGVKFSVRSSTYAGGASIHCRWTDGPPEAKVKACVSLYEGASFDGMIDLKSHHDTLLMGDDGTPQLVSMGADFIFADRDLSQQWVDVIARQIERISGQPCDLSRFVYGKNWKDRSGYNGAGWETRYEVCVVDGKFSRYAGLEYGRDLVHRYAQSRARVPVWKT